MKSMAALCLAVNFFNLCRGSESDLFYLSQIIKANDRLAVKASMQQGFTKYLSTTAPCFLYGTPLHLAVSAGATNAVRALMQYHPPLTSLDTYGRAPVQAAVITSWSITGYDMQLIELLCQHVSKCSAFEQSQLISATDTLDQETVLHSAARTAWHDLIHFFLLLRANPRACNKEGQHLGHILAKLGCPLAQVRTLLHNGNIDPLILQDQDSYGNTAIYYAESASQEERQRYQRRRQQVEYSATGVLEELIAQRVEPS